MAMTKCKECGAAVSDQAKACPSCGAMRTPAISVVRLLILFVIVGGLFWWVGSQGPELDENLQPVKSAAP